MGLEFCNLKNEQILSIVEPLMQNCLDGSNEDNYEKHTLNFTGRMKGIVTPDELKRQLSSEPRIYFRERQFIELFRRVDSIAVVWKQRISSCDDELINQAIFKEEKGEILIDHCMIC